jgi:hypothetical protein
MFGFRLSVKCVTGVILAGFVASGAVAAQAQQQPTHHTRRESSANRKSRIARTIAETYGHRFEVAGGGGFLRFQSGAPQRNNEVTFFMTGTYFLNPKLGIIGDVRGAYGNAKIGNTACTVVGCIPVNLGFNPQISQYPFLGGVAYRLYAKEKIAVTATGEGGVALGKFDGAAKALPSAVLGVWESKTKPAFSLGLNVDYNFYPNLAFRLSPTYLGTFYRRDPADVNHGPDGTIQNNWGFNAGIVYRFGKIK